MATNPCSIHPRLKDKSLTKEVSVGTHIHCIPLPGALGLPQGKPIMVLAGQDNIPTINDNIGEITIMRKKNMSLKLAAEIANKCCWDESARNWLWSISDPLYPTEERSWKSGPIPITTPHAGSPCRLDGAVATGCNIGCRTLFSERGKLSLKLTGPTALPLAPPLC